MPLFTRRRLLAAAPATGLAVGAASVRSGGASAAGGGTIEFVPPFRLQDSRVNEPFKYGTGARDNLAIFGPAGYCGVVLNVTVTETEGEGYFRIADDFQEPAETSTVNWYTDGQTVANMAIVSTPSGTGIAVQGGGDGQAHLVIDVLGFVV